jgi:hypothetical protein
MAGCCAEAEAEAEDWIRREVEIPRAHGAMAWTMEEVDDEDEEEAEGIVRGHTAVTRIGNVLPTATVLA